MKSAQRQVEVLLVSDITGEQLEERGPILANLLASKGIIEPDGSDCSICDVTFVLMSVSEARRQMSLLAAGELVVIDLAGQKDGPAMELLRRLIMRFEQVCVACLLDINKLLLEETRTPPKPRCGITRAVPQSWLS